MFLARDLAGSITNTIKTRENTTTSFHSVFLLYLLLAYRPMYTSGPYMRNYGLYKAIDFI